MKATTVLLVAILVVLLVLAVYAVAKDPSWARKSYWLANFIESPWKVYRRSDGTFDDAAQIALQRVTSRGNLTPSEHLLSARIITRNILGQEHRPERTATGELTPAAVERARLRRGMFDQARGHYAAALADLARGPAQRGGAARERDREAWDHEAEQVLTAALEYAFGGVAGLLANDGALAAIAVGNWDYPVEVIPRRGGAPLMVDRPLAMQAGHLQKELVEARRAAAREVAEAQGGARGAGVGAYVALATQHTDDPQNVHDTGVLASQRPIVSRLRADQGALGNLPTLDEIAAAIKQNGQVYSEGRPEKVADALAVVERAKKGERVISLDVSDEEALRRAWARADDPRNASVRGAMRQAIFDGLVDSWEEGVAGRKIMCVNGRTSRHLGALVLLDWDERNWEVKKLEQFKNDIFAKAHETILATAQQAAESGDPDRQKAGRLYLATTATETAAIGPVPEAATEALTGEMREAISAMVDAHVAELETTLGIKDAIPAYQLEATKTEALAALS